MFTSQQSQGPILFLVRFHSFLRQILKRSSTSKISPITNHGTLNMFYGQVQGCIHYSKVLLLRAVLRFLLVGWLLYNFEQRWRGQCDVECGRNNTRKIVIFLTFGCFSRHNRDSIVTFSCAGNSTASLGSHGVLLSFTL